MGDVGVYRPPYTSATGVVAGKAKELVLAIPYCIPVIYVSEFKYTSGSLTSGVAAIIETSTETSIYNFITIQELTTQCCNIIESWLIQVIYVPRLCNANLYL